MSASARSAGVPVTAAPWHSPAASAEKSTISVPEKRPTSRASSPPSMISPPSIDWSAISDAPTPLLRISVCPTALSATSSVPTELAARSAAVRLLSPTLPVITLPGASARVLTAASASLEATIEPSASRSGHGPRAC